MVCENCFQENKGSLEQKTCSVVDRRQLIVFLLNVILNIESTWKEYCFCDTVVVKCSVCQFRDACKNTEYHIYENCFNFHFLVTFHANLYIHLKKLLAASDHFVCNWINKSFCYKYKDWFTGQIELYSLSDCIAAYEKREIDKIINNSFKIVIWYFIENNVYCLWNYFFIKSWICFIVFAALWEIRTTAHEKWRELWKFLHAQKTVKFAKKRPTEKSIIIIDGKLTLTDI